MFIIHVNWFFSFIPLADLSIVEQQKYSQDNGFAELLLNNTSFFQGEVLHTSGQPSEEGKIIQICFIMNMLPEVFIEKHIACVFAFIQDFSALVFPVYPIELGHLLKPKRQQLPLAKKKSNLHS